MMCHFHFVMCNDQTDDRQFVYIHVVETTEYYDRQVNSMNFYIIFFFFRQVKVTENKSESSLEKGLGIRADPFILCLWFGLYPFRERKRLLKVSKERMEIA